MALSTAQIKKALRDRKLTYREVAATVGVSTSLVTRNVNKNAGSRSRRVRTAIADAIGLSIEDVYGEAA